MSTLPMVIRHAIETHARLRMVCEALGIDTCNVRLNDLSEEMKKRLLDLGEDDWVAWLNNETPDETGD